MILPVSNFSDKKLAFSAKSRDEKLLPYDQDTLLENNFSTRMRIGMDKLTKAFTVYPAKGISGSKNSNFYEFLTMGLVPYIVGSATLMAIFNAANKHYGNSDKFFAGPLAKKMALGVLFYGIFKSLSKSLVDVPVKLATGIDTQLPYARVIYELPEYDGDSDLKSIEYHKVGESVDFTRWDLLYGEQKKGEELNFRYDKIAKKNGLGENLNDSDQDVKPIYKEVLVKSTLARSFSSFMWAAIGVMIAFQKPWEEFFNTATLKVWKPTEFGHSLKTFGRSFVKSVKEFYKGPEGTIPHFKKHAGKYMLGAASVITILGVLNTIHIRKKPQNESVIDKNKESVVS